jgi:hypothetical protein
MAIRQARLPSVATWQVEDHPISPARPAMGTGTLTKDEARYIAANIAGLSDLLRRRLPNATKNGIQAHR